MGWSNNLHGGSVLFLTPSTASRVNYAAQIVRDVTDR